MGVVNNNAWDNPVTDAQTAEFHFSLLEFHGQAPMSPEMMVFFCDATEDVFDSARGELS